MVGPAGVSPPALSDPETESFQPLVPDSAALACWDRALCWGILGLAAEPSGPGEELDTVLAGRPTLFPLPGELPRGHLALARIRRLGAELAALHGPPEVQEGEARPATRPVFWPLVAAVALGDGASALHALDRLEPEAGDRSTRWRLSGLRAQIYLGEKQIPQALAIVNHLQSRVARKGETIEEAGGRITLSESYLPGGLDWVERLHDCAVDMSGGRLPDDSEATTPFGLPMMGGAAADELIQLPDVLPQAPPDPQPPPDAGPPRRRGFR